MNANNLFHSPQDPCRSKLYVRLVSLWGSLQSSDGAIFWHRTLPWGDDYFVDRWEKARRLGLCAGSSIYNNSLVLGDLKAGENTRGGLA